MQNTSAPLPVIETERLVLRGATAEDAPALLAMMQDPEVLRYYGMSRFESLQQAVREIGWFGDLWEHGQGIRWAIDELGGAHYIGDIGLHNLVRAHARAEVGYRLARGYWRRGYMGEALRAVVGYGLEAMALNRIEALVDTRNTASCRLAEKVGFIREGVLREYEYENGAFVDLAMYSLLRRDWGG